MKLSKEEWAEIDRIKSVCHDNADKAALNVRIDFLCAMLEKSRSKPERFTYQMVACDFCVISDAQPCRECGGLGKTRVKVKRTAHSV